MIYSRMAAKALHTEVVPSEVTSLIFFFFFGVVGFSFSGVWDNSVYKKEVSSFPKE